MEISREERQRLLQEKKLQLALAKEGRRRADDERRRTILPQQAAALANGIPRATLTDAELQGLLADAGVPAHTSSTATTTQPSQPPAGHGTDDERAATKENGFAHPKSQLASTTSRMISLTITEPTSIAIQKDSAIYCKTTQTDDDRIGHADFSDGSQDLCFDDDMMPYRQSHDDRSPDEHNILTRLGFGRRPAEEAPAEEEQRVPDLSEEEKHQIMTTLAFQAFFGKASKILERAITEDDRVFTDYAADDTMQEENVVERLTYRRTFADAKWTAGREVVAISFSEKFPELFAVAYDTNQDQPSEPAGVLAVYSTKFKKDNAEFIFHTQSRITSIAFARYHPNLLLAGCYTGQICMWDNRVFNKKTPINRSPLSTMTHTQPIFSIQVVGTHNSSNLVSISTDGKMCSWNVDNLAQPVDMKMLSAKSDRGLRSIHPTCMAFPANDCSNYVVGAEDGIVHLLSRHGSNAENQLIEQQFFEGHSAPISAVSFHRTPINAQIDFSHLFLSASCDWSVKLWSIKDPLLRHSFEMHTEYVYDVQWSPVHPALFATIDADGTLCLWNLNEDIEGPVAKIPIDKENGQAQGRKLAFSLNGQFIVTGDDHGTVNVFELQENLYSPKSDEWIKFERVLADAKAAKLETDEMGELVAGGGGRAPSSTNLPSSTAIINPSTTTTTTPSNISILAGGGGGGSPRQNWV
ncbi:unnamed protein product, partial [Mesorhabditis spiculigera]